MFRKSAILIFSITLIAFVACSSGSREGTQTQNAPPAAQPPATPPAQAQQQEPPAKPEVEPARSEPAAKAPRDVAARPAAQAAAAPVRPAETPAPIPPAAKPAAEPAGQAALPAANVAPPPPPPPVRPLVIASGTRFEVRLADPIDSKTNKTGDTFRATLDQNLEVDGKIAAPRGSLLKGRIVSVKEPGRVEGRAAMSIVLTGITVNKVDYPIETNTLAFEAEKSTKEDATKIGIGAGVGAIIGAIAGGGKGAAIGAAVGGGAGTATVLATKGKDVKFPAEERFSFVLKGDLSVKQ